MLFFLRNLFKKLQNGFCIFILHFVFSVWSGCFKSSYGVGFKIQTTNTLYIPIFLEIIILLAVSFSAFLLPNEYARFSILLSSALLFFYGITECIGNEGIPIGGKNYPPNGFVHGSGNRTVTRCSFTEIGQKRIQLNKSIFLKLAIICCFFLGCIIGGFTYSLS